MVGMLMVVVRIRLLRRRIRRGLEVVEVGLIIFRKTIMKIRRRWLGRIEVVEMAVAVPTISDDKKWRKNSKNILMIVA